LCRGEAHLHAFAGHGDALFFQHGALFGGHLLLELTEDQRQVRQVLVIDFHVAGGQFPQARRQHLRLRCHRQRQTNNHGQTKQTSIHRVTPGQLWALDAAKVPVLHGK
jgi:hypothetical protein